MNEIYTDSKGKRWLVGLKVDRDALVNRLWRRAEKSKRGTATALGGAVTLQIKQADDA